VSAQVGIGAGGGVNYPGLSASDFHNSRFKAGAGYDIFVRHRLLKLTDNYILHAKYSVSNYFSDIELVRVGNTRFKFNYLSVEIVFPFKTIDAFKLVAGAGINLINATTVQRYFESNESLLLPTVSIGTEYWFNKNYNVFGLFNFQFGEFEDNGQNLPIHGFRFQVGATMFFTE
jgi:hypothetical protein